MSLWTCENIELNINLISKQGFSIYITEGTVEKYGQSAPNVLIKTKFYNISGNIIVTIFQVYQTVVLYHPHSQLITPKQLINYSMSLRCT